LQFRVGMFVIVAACAVAAMIFHFGDIRSLWEPRYQVLVHFESAPNVYESTPVRRNGVTIGSVVDVRFDDDRGGVIVVLEIRNDVKLRKDAQARLISSLLGDATIEFTPGRDPASLAAGAKLEGEMPTDPAEMISRLDRKFSATIDSFHATSNEWQKVGKNVNGLLETNRGNLNVVIERSAEALHQFTLAMRHAEQTLAQTHAVVGDPKNQENLRKTLEAMPQLVEDTQRTIVAVKSAVQRMDLNLANLGEVTTPLAKRSTTLVSRLDATLGNMEVLSDELAQFAQLLTKEDGSVRKFVSDPELYRNLSSSAGSLAVLLQNLEPIVRDMRIFSDKIARHPELIGVSGALRGSSGLKDPAEPAKAPLRIGNQPSVRGQR
ncbi:MAG: MlaD family protein, partial [Planctomycetaceae bacterium]